LKVLSLGTTDASEEIGKYLKRPTSDSTSALPEVSTERIKKRPKGFGSFDNW
jgi:hypothetical protein